MLPPRCLHCGYVLTGLDSGRCPECGRAFDPGLPGTFTYKPLFNRWQFWLPGLLMALITGAVLYPLLIYFAGFGWTVTIVLPICLGTLIGYSCRVSIFFRVVLSLVVLACVIFLLFTMSFVGIFCALVTSMVALGPLIFGTLMGVALRNRLKASNWEQRWYLPTLLALLAVLLVGAIESRHRPRYADESVSTTVELPVSIDRAWDSVMLYEDVHHAPPWLMRFVLPRPLYTRGSMEHVGDMKVCVYNKGRLVKRVTQREPELLLSFDIVEQTHIENQSVVLERGSFTFVPLAADRTQVTLTTAYQPLLGPRFAWRWAEELGMHTLHGHVLKGMELKAMEDSSVKPGPGT